MQWFFSGIGIVCLLFGSYLALMTRTEEIHEGAPPPPPQKSTVRKVSRDHSANWGAAEGFAMAGGLCLIAAALAHRADGPNRRGQGNMDAMLGEEEYLHKVRRS